MLAPPASSMRDAMLRVVSGFLPTALVVAALAVSCAMQYKFPQPPILDVSLKAQITACLCSAVPRKPHSQLSPTPSQFNNPLIHTGPQIDSA